MSLKIIGAGMAGLLAGNLLHRRDPELFERQMALPNNHSAVLRFKTSTIGDALNIPFKKVTMIKTHVPGQNLVADALNYSFKNTGVRRSDRSITKGATVEDRFIAPSDLIARMAERLQICYGFSFSATTLDLWQRNSAEDWCPIISTLPMILLMSILNYPKLKDVQFSSSPGLSIKATIQNCDAYVSLLIPEPGLAFSRVSITGDELILEMPNFDYSEITDEVELQSIAQTQVWMALEFLQISQVAVRDIKAFKMPYAKINPIDEDARKDFIYWATDVHGIFSLGRFATWRPRLLLDDLVQDIKLIDKWLDKKDRFAIARAR